MTLPSALGIAVVGSGYTSASILSHLLDLQPELAAQDLIRLGQLFVGFFECTLYYARKPPPFFMDIRGNECVPVVGCVFVARIVLLWFGCGHMVGGLSVVGCVLVVACVPVARVVLWKGKPQGVSRSSEWMPVQ